MRCAASDASDVRRVPRDGVDVGAAGQLAGEHALGLQPGERRHDRGVGEPATELGEHVARGQGPAGGGQAGQHLRSSAPRGRGVWLGMPTSAASTTVSVVRPSPVGPSIVPPPEYPDVLEGPPHGRDLTPPRSSRSTRWTRTACCRASARSGSSSCCSPRPACSSGFFLPGDSLLFTAGLLCTTSGRTAACTCRWARVLPAAVAGAVLGAQAGYLIGAKAGPPLLDRPGRPRLQQAVARARASLERYGAGKAIVLARFIPLVRTVLNPLAGTVGVPVRTFTFWQVLGGVVWSVGRHAGRLRPGLPHPERRHLPPAHHRRHRRALPDPGPAGAAPLARSRA